MNRTKKAATPIDLEGYALAALRVGLAAGKIVAIVSIHLIWSKKLNYALWGEGNHNADGAPSGPLLDATGRS